MLADDRLGKAALEHFDPWKNAHSPSDCPYLGLLCHGRGFASVEEHHRVGIPGSPSMNEETAEAYRCLGMLCHGYDFAQVKEVL